MEVGLREGANATVGDQGVMDHFYIQAFIDGEWVNYYFVRSRLKADERMRQYSAKYTEWEWRIVPYD